MAGAGKRTALQEALKAVAVARGVSFTLQTHPLSSIQGKGGGANANTSSGQPVLAQEGGGAETGSAEDVAGPDEAETGQFMYESSLVHIGLDIARMSMQDKHILRPVLLRLGQGSQVLGGHQGHAARIVVLYHAHLLSSESVILLQACLEQNEGDLSIWMTSEMPGPGRIRDWFVELPVAGEDNSFSEYADTMSAPVVHWPDLFHELVTKWSTADAPRLGEVQGIKALVYEMLMRNLRWVEMTHYLLDCLLTHKGLTETQRRRGVEVLAAAEATGGGMTLPSYRSPILWESLLLQLRSMLCSPASSEKGAASTATSANHVKAKKPSTRAKGTAGQRKKGVEPASS